MSKRNLDVAKGRDILWPDVRITKSFGDPVKAQTNVPVGDWPTEKYAMFVCGEGATEEDAIAALRDEVDKTIAAAVGWEPSETKVIRVEP